MPKRQFNAIVNKLPHSIPKNKDFRKMIPTVDYFRKYVSGIDEQSMIVKFSNTKLREIERTLQATTGLCFVMHYPDISIFVSKNTLMSDDETLVLEYMVLKYV